MSHQFAQDLLVPNITVFFIFSSPVPPTKDSVTEEGQTDPSQPMWLLVSTLQSIHKECYGQILI